MRGSFQPQVFGKYFLAERFATGGMAEIYKAKTFGIDGFEKQIVIKKILPQWSGNSDFIQMLIDEAKLSVLLTHANIVQIYDLGKVDEDYYISMEYVHGYDLRKILTQLKSEHETLPAAFAVYITSEVCRGLDYAHSKKDKRGRPLQIIHRDINPPNILVSFEGEVKIGDFGIAKAAQNMSHTTAGMLKGKISYLSPEQAAGQPIDRRADIFSTGAVLYELLTGEPLFNGETVFEVLAQIRGAQFNENSFPPSIPEKLRQVLAKALAYSDRERYHSASEMQIALIHYLYSAHSDFTHYQLAQWMQKNFKDHDRPESEMIPPSVGSWMAGQKSVSLLGDITSPESIPEAPVSRSRALWRVMAAVLPVLLLAGLGLWFFFKPAPVKKEIAVKKESPPLMGILQIQSDPAGAMILLNGFDTGLASPTQIQGVELGKLQTVVLKKANYKDFTQNVMLLNSQPLVLNLKLEKALALGKEKIAVRTSSKDEPAKEGEAPKAGNPIKRGFTKAGGSIKNFFGGGDNEEKKK